MRRLYDNQICFTKIGCSHRLVIETISKLYTTIPERDAEKILWSTLLRNLTTLVHIMTKVTKYIVTFSDVCTMSLYITKDYNTHSNIGPNPGPKCSSKYSSKAQPNIIVSEDISAG